MKLIIRKADGATFRASSPDGYDMAQALADLVSSDKPSFYFRRIRRERNWLGRKRWVDTGEVWEPKSGEFWVVEI